MSVPNLEHLVQAVRARYPEHFPDRHMLCVYGHEVLVALHRADARFGCLKKSEGQNHCMEPNFTRRAVDVALFKPTGQIVDFIQSAGFGDGTTNAVAWGVGP